jgi:excisionase family DNA binding protein
VERTDYDLLSIDEVARTIGQSVRTVRRMIQDGEFPQGFPAPKVLRWRWSTVRDWILMTEASFKVLPKRDNPGQTGTSKKPP